MFNPFFKISKKLLKDLNRLEVLREKISTAKVLHQQALHLKNTAIISMIHHSTAIEGNKLSLLQVQQVLKGQEVDASMRDIYEVNNYNKAFEYILEQSTGSVNTEVIL